MENKRLTWKRDLGGHTDVGLRDGVTVGEAICKLANYEEAEYTSIKDLVEKPGVWEPHPYHPGLCRCSKCKEFIIPEDSVDGELWKYCPKCGKRLLALLDEAEGE